jgi:hypothetical protein
LRKTLSLALLILLLFPLSLAAQQSTSQTSTQFDSSSLSPWARDLRRGEIIAFGSFPFTFLLAIFSVDCYRFFSHGMNSLYAPWPAKPAGAIEMSQAEQGLTIAVAAGTSLLVAVVDHIIIRYKRYKKAQEIENLPRGTPIIIQRPRNSPAAEGDAEGNSGGENGPGRDEEAPPGSP